MKSILLAITAICFSFYYLPKTDLVIGSSTLPSKNYWSGTADFFTEPALADSYKAKVVQAVFNKLKNAKGDFRSRRPYLHFVKQSGSGVAAAYPKTGLILLEEKGYDICTSFGKDSLNALAVFLAHELVHCYEKHDWEEYFAAEFKGFGPGGDVKDNLKEDEIQADYLGGFLAYQAGFTPFGIMPKFLDKVYQEYGLSDEKLSNYPKKEERKDIAKQSEEKLKGLLDLFEMGNFLLALEEYDDALEYYYKVLEDFQSREIYNNLGVLSTLSAMKLFTPLQNKFYYPVELDVKTRLGGRGDLNKELREQKLLDAIDFFEKARQLDAFYPIAYLNEGCAHALLGLSQTEFSGLEWDDAEYATQRAIRLAKDSPDGAHTMADAQVLLGILRALKNDSTQAEFHFAEALKWNEHHFLATANRQVLRGATPEKRTVGGTDLSNEVIDNTVFSTIRLTVSDKKADILNLEDYKIILLGKSYDHSLVLANNSVRGTGGNKSKMNTFLQLTGTDYNLPTARGATVGDSQQAVVEKYGEPSARLSLGNGEFLRYKSVEQSGSGGVIFQFNAGKLMRWCVYRQVR